MLSSDPGSGSTATKGTVVNLTVSNGKVQLPDVTNQQFPAANQTLQNLGLTVGQNPSYSCTGGLVTQQDQPAGDIAQGSTVTLTYCAGSAQPQQTEQPSAGDSSGGKGDGGKRGRRADAGPSGSATTADADPAGRPARVQEHRACAPGRLGRGAASGPVCGDERVEVGRPRSGAVQPGGLEPVAHHPVAALREDGLGVELHAVDGVVAVLDAHDHAATRPSRHDELVGDRSVDDREGVVARRG